MQEAVPDSHTSQLYVINWPDIKSTKHERSIEVNTYKLAHTNLRIFFRLILLFASEQKHK